MTTSSATLIPPNGKGSNGNGKGNSSGTKNKQKSNGSRPRSNNKEKKRNFTESLAEMKPVNPVEIHVPKANGKTRDLVNKAESSDKSDV